VVLVLLIVLVVPVDGQLQFSADAGSRMHSLVVAGAAIVAELVLLLIVVRVAPGSRCQYPVAGVFSRGNCSLVVARAPVVDEAGGGEESGGSHCEYWGGRVEEEVVVMRWVGECWLLGRVGGERDELVSEAARAGCFVWLMSVADDESRFPNLGSERNLYSRRTKSRCLESNAGTSPIPFRASMSA